MEQWRVEKELVEVVGLELFQELELVERVGDKWQLIYTYSSTLAVLLWISTECLYDKLGLNDNECAHKTQLYLEEMHKYNRIKDTAEEIIGLLADRAGVSLAEMRQKYAIEAVDGEEEEEIGLR
ncbi:hypothetical protein NEHOM01_0007 [Nematocida homosporus]|uniref:uncharacterized protein n=1 Tax=Nematocida homosporus TaxID=1912981 RepID=UPI0022212964|nr:uncharacterized protein NEHOM01_0007 [Nematocida homosporus]KAI5184262.1 hypothetical protein NEHOM01_0007 [Nematocida homosporus]